MGCLKLTYQDKSYYPFGMEMKTYVNEEYASYRYGNNTQERDDEIYGEGNSYSAEFWQYDARLGRRWNVDPRPITSISVYACFGNNPIYYSDIQGDSLDGEDQLTKLSSNVAGSIVKGSKTFSNFLDKVRNSSVVHMKIIAVNNDDNETLSASADGMASIKYQLSDGTSIDAGKYDASTHGAVSKVYIEVLIRKAKIDANNSITDAAVAELQTIVHEIMIHAVHEARLIRQNTNKDGVTDVQHLKNDYNRFYDDDAAVHFDHQQLARRRFKTYEKASKEILSFLNTSTFGGLSTTHKNYSSHRGAMHTIKTAWDVFSYIHMYSYYASNGKPVPPFTALANKYKSWSDEEKNKEK